MRRVALATVLLAISSIISEAASPTPAAPQPLTGATQAPRFADIDKNSALILIRTTLIAVQQGNQTGNYSVLHALTAPAFQKENSAERLAQAFAKLRATKFDLSGVLVLEPQFTVLPELYSNNVMRMAGFFPSVPMQVYFDLQFAPVEGRWRSVAIAIDVASSTPAAPTPNPALASSYPSPAATATPTPTPKPSPPSVDVRTQSKATPAPRKTLTPARSSLGRP